MPTVEDYLRKDSSNEVGAQIILRKCSDIEMHHRIGINRPVADLAHGYDKALHHEQEKEDLSNLSESALQKKLKKIDEQVAFLRAENRLLVNYLRWYETRILHHTDYPKQFAHTSPPKNEESLPSARTSKHINPSTLSIQKKRDIAETTCRILLAYSQKYSNTTSDYVDQCLNTIATDDDTLVHLELELTILRKFIQKIQRELRDHQKIFTAEELLEFIRDRIRYREALEERKRQKSVRLRFHIDAIDKSIRKVGQAVDTITEADFEQLKIDIEKQVKELNKKNQMLIVYKRQQSEANVKLNIQKPDLFRVIRRLTSLRHETNRRIHQLNHYEQVKQKMEEEIVEYEAINGPLRTMTITYRVPSIIDYINLKSKQIHLHRQEQAWVRKVQIVEREKHLRQRDARHHPEAVVHPWKYLQNPSDILFHRRCKTPSDRKLEANAQNTFSSLPKTSIYIST